ncbi:cyclin p3 [Perilla frutescens var. frutescens]|nr:cyclin p3 [Perilla frutescens var. frutescens]
MGNQVRNVLQKESGQSDEKRVRTKQNSERLPELGNTRDRTRDRGGRESGRESPFFPFSAWRDRGRVLLCFTRDPVVNFKRHVMPRIATWTRDPSRGFGTLIIEEKNSSNREATSLGRVRKLGRPNGLFLYRVDPSDRAGSEESNIPLVISVVASLIERTLARNERIIKKCKWPQWKTGGVFDCSETPDLTVQSYLERIFRYTRAGPSVYVVAYVYIDRFCQLYPDFRIAPTNVHRLLITTLMLASKYVEDMNYRNSYFARVGGLTTDQINKLELDFLFLIKFKLHVNVSVYESYCSHLEREVSIGGGYQIERTLRCAVEIKTKHREERRYINDRNQIARLLL